jgi:RpiB/LacA/LacB family sugar-phosphate isomerase
MQVAVGADHAGFDLKQLIAAHLAHLGHAVEDLGTGGHEAVDYPDFSREVALAVREKRAERGVLICGSGVGASVAANKVPGVRAGLCHDCYSARQGVEHDDMNVLVLGARVIGTELAKDLVSAFMSASFSGAERHRRRLAKVRTLEEEFAPGGTGGEAPQRERRP